MNNYVVIIEECKNGGYSAYVPDLPGCISVGESMDEIKSNIKEAIDLYIEELEMNKMPIPLSRSQAFNMAV